MPLDVSTVGHSTRMFTHDVDARWIMAYSAGLNDYNPLYLDTTAHKVVAHPVFPVCLEWPVILDSRHLPGSENLTPQEAARGVHAAHDLHIYQPITDGNRLQTTATVVGLKRIRPGAAQTTRLDTVNADTGKPVCRTYQLGISRGVDVTGEATESEIAPPTPVGNGNESPLAEWPMAVSTGAAHVYTECARIFNPIHTDRTVALAAGLPDIILHGTATMAMAVGHLVAQRLGGDPTRVRRLGGRFSAMVLMPSTITLKLYDDRDNTLFYEVATEDGACAFSNGFLCYE